MKRLTFRAGTEWDAEDVLHDAYERAIRYADSFKGDNFDGWFNTIVNNARKEHLAAARGQTVEFDEEEEDGTPCLYYNERIMDEVFRLIDTKNEIQREILSLHFKQEYLPIDISRVTDYNHSSCKQVIKRFRDELKQLFQH